MKRIYTAGPMTGYPESNYPAFAAEAERLRRLGYEVENPAEGPEEASWEAYMRRGLLQLLRCDTVAVLPDWQHSKGASIEVEVGRVCGLEIVPASAIVERVRV